MATTDDWEEVKPKHADDWEEVPTANVRPEDIHGGERPFNNGDIGEGGTYLAHTARHLGYGLGDKITAAIQAAQDVHHDKTGKVTLGDAYARDLAFNDKTLETADKLHPAARWLGNTTGVVGSALAPAGALRAARALKLLAAAPAAAPQALSIGASALQGLKTGTALGAVGGYGADRSDSIGGTALNTGLGAVEGGALGGTLGAAVPTIARPIARYLRTKSNTLAARALRGTATEYKKLGKDGVQEVGNWLHENKAIGFGDTPEDLAPKVDALRTKAGAAMSGALDQAEQAGVRVDPEEYARRLETEALDASKYGPAAKGRVAQLKDAADQVRQEIQSSVPRRFVGGQPLGRTLSPAEAELWKQGYQEVAYPKGQRPLSPSPSQATDMDIARHAKEVTEDALENGMQGKGVADAYRSAKKDYGTAVLLNKMLEGAEGRHEARLLASPSDKAHLIMGLATHNPVLGIAGAGVNHIAGSRMPASLAVTARALSKAIPWAAEGAPVLGTESSSQVADPYMRALAEALRRRQPPAIPANAVASEDSSQ